MTVHYISKVPNASFIDFVRVLFRWRGSLWKHVIIELIIWMLLYLLLTLIYRLALREDQKRMFEAVVITCNKAIKLIPVTMILGFYGTLVMSRWWQQYSWMGWPDNFALLLASWIKGADDKARMFRRAVVRYMLLYQLLVLRYISIRVRKIFPTLKTILEAGYISASEFPFIEDTKFWLPVKWSCYLLRKARQEGYIDCDYALSTCLTTICLWRGDVIKLWLADWVPVPLVYSQVTFTCVRVLFLANAVGRQYLDVEHSKGSISPIDAYVPFLEIIQFICYIGWLKVAEILVCPFGEDDTDFETHIFIQRNLANIGWKPPLRRDDFWHEKTPSMLYTVETADIKQNPIIGSAAFQKRRSSKGVQMVPRLEAATSIASLHTYYKVTELKAVEPIVDNSFEFESPEIITKFVPNGDITSVLPRKSPRTSLTDGIILAENDDKIRRFRRLASKDGQLASVSEVDECVGDSNNDWGDVYLDGPESKKEK